MPRVKRVPLGMPLTKHKMGTLKGNITLSDMHEKFGETLAMITKDRKAEVEAKVCFDQEGGQ